MKGWLARRRDRQINEFLEDFKRTGDYGFKWRVKPNGIIRSDEPFPTCPGSGVVYVRTGRKYSDEEFLSRISRPRVPFMLRCLIVEAADSMHPSPRARHMREEMLHIIADLHANPCDALHEEAGDLVSVG